MIAIFETILPIFLLMAVGNLLKRSPLINATAWPGMEQLAYWVLYPTLLFVTIYNADFSGLALDAMLIALMMSLVIMGALVLALWPPMRTSGLITPSEYSSVFQTAMRWNGFMALAIAQKLFPPEGVAVVALAMAVIIIPLNVSSVMVVTRFAARSADWLAIARSVAINPLIVASFAAIFLRMLPFGLYEPLNEALRLTGSAALGLGLLAIGAGLRLNDFSGFRRVAFWLPTVVKLVGFPITMVALGLALGVRGDQLYYLSLCAAVPAAMNGYLLARQLGGDAELYAAITTLQTALSFFTIPAVLYITLLIN